MLTPEQLDWLAEQAGWKVDHTKLHPYQRSGDILDVNPSTSCDRLIADHGEWMWEHGITYGLWSDERRFRALKSGMSHPDVFVADTPEDALAEAFYHARGGSQ